MTRAISRRPRGLGAALSAGATLACLAVTAGSAQAATYTVTGTADTSSGTCQPSSCSLRQAVEAAGDGDTITLPASATPYHVTNGPLFVLSAVRIVGAGAGSTTISGAGGSTRVMNIFNNGSPVTLENLTVTGGQATTSGGAIASAAGAGVVLRGVTVTGNTVTSTAGSQFNAGGGGIWSSAPVTLIDSVVSDNTVTVASSDGDSGGGGILMAQISDNSDDLTLLDSSVTGNSATVTADGGGTTDANGGGGIYQDGGNLTITGSDIADNTATMPPDQTTNTGTPTDGGGGIFMFGNIMRLEDSTVSGNSTTAPGPLKSGGGGVLDSGNQSTYINDTITANTATVPVDPTDNSEEGGGGLLLNDLKEGALIANSTINANGAPGSSGGGINSQLTDITELTDTIVAGNSAQTGEGNCSGEVLSFGYNLTDDPASANSCQLTGPGDLLSASPLLGALGANGGPVPTEALKPGSPAIGAGDPAGCVDLLGSMIGVDARGALRPSGAGCDIGAYQVALPSAVTGAAYLTPSGVVLSGTAANPDPRAGTVSFQYGKTSAYGASSPAQPLPGAAGKTTYTAALSALAAGTYHFRLVANGPDGTTDGSDGTFTVAAPASPPTVAPSKPIVTTLHPRSIAARRVTLYGVVDPEAQGTRYYFIWGRSPTVLTHRTRKRTLGAVTRGIAVTATLGRLRPNTRYSVRVIAVSPAGVSIGGTVSFRTLRLPRHKRR